MLRVAPVLCAGQWVGSSHHHTSAMKLWLKKKRQGKLGAWWELSGCAFEDGNVGRIEVRTVGDAWNIEERGNKRMWVKGEHRDS